MDRRGIQQYKDQSRSLEALSAMTPGELLNLLLDELVKRLLRGEIALENGDIELFEASIDRCLAIVRYLDDTLDRRYEIGQELHRLYDFFSYELNRIRWGRNRSELETLKPLILDLRDAFRAAEKTEREKARTGAAP